MITTPMSPIPIKMQEIVRPLQRDISMARHLLPQEVHAVQAVHVVTRPYVQREFGDEAVADVVLRVS